MEPLKLFMLVGDTSPGFSHHNVRMDVLRAFFTVSNLTDSHDDCFIDNFQLYQNKGLTSTLPSSDALKLNQNGLS